jgi:hypothetical protein
MGGEMKNFGERLAAARDKRPTKDVDIILDADLSAREAELVARIDQLKADGEDQRMGVVPESERLTEELAALNAETHADLVTLRFTRLNGNDWAYLTAKSPARLDVAVDVHYGYNFAAVCEAAAKFKDPKTGRAFGHVLDGDELVELTDGEWDDLFAETAGNGVSRIYTTIWELNEYDPSARVQELVKA